MPSPEDLANDPDFTLRWPRDLFNDELTHLMERSTRHYADWTEEVETLLRQAFVSSTPAEEFRRLESMTKPPTDDDVPF